MCYCTGLAGYLAFRSATDGDILDNFAGPMAACFKVLVVVHLILHTPCHVRFGTVGCRPGERGRRITVYDGPTVEEVEAAGRTRASIDVAHFG